MFSCVLCRGFSLHFFKQYLVACFQRYNTDCPTIQIHRSLEYNIFVLHFTTLFEKICNIWYNLVLFNAVCCAYYTLACTWAAHLQFVRANVFFSFFSLLSDICLCELWSDEICIFVLGFISFLWIFVLFKSFCCGCIVVVLGMRAEVVQRYKDKMFA